MFVDKDTGEVLGSGVRSLTLRERDLCDCVARGMRNAEIAGALGLTEGTVKMYLVRLFDKVSVHSRTELALWWADVKRKQGEL